MPEPIYSPAECLAALVKLHDRDAAFMAANASDIAQDTIEEFAEALYDNARASLRSVSFEDLPSAMLREVNEGDVLVIDSGFTCRGPGAVKIERDDHGLYFACCAADEEVHEQGTDAQVEPAKLTDKHYLDGQETDTGALAGMARPYLEPVAQ
jgi:hypothetical protein